MRGFHCNTTPDRIRIGMDFASNILDTRTFQQVFFGHPLYLYIGTSWMVLV